MESTYRGIVQGGSVLLSGTDVSLEDGTLVLVVPISSSAGTSAALLDAMKRGPHLVDEDLKALEESISSGRRPRSQVDLFADPSTTTGSAECQ